MRYQCSASLALGALALHLVLPTNTSHVLAATLLTLIDGIYIGFSVVDVDECSAFDPDRLPCTCAMGFLASFATVQGCDAEVANSRMCGGRGDCRDGVVADLGVMTANIFRAQLEPYGHHHTALEVRDNRLHG